MLIGFLIKKKMLIGFGENRKINWHSHVSEWESYNVFSCLSLFEFWLSSCFLSKKIKITKKTVLYIINIVYVTENNSLESSTVSGDLYFTDFSTKFLTVVKAFSIFERINSLLFHVQLQTLESKMCCIYRILLEGW